MDIVFSTFNARYSHTALALRCLRANLGGLHDRSVIVEFDNRLSPQAAAEKLLEHNPKIILFSIYIWNLIVTYETMTLLRALRPGLKIIIGGPEVSYEYHDSLTVQLADHLVCGEGESVIEELCRTLLDEQGRLEAGDTSSVPPASSRPCPDSVPPASSRPCLDSVPPASSRPRFNSFQEVHQSQRKNLPHWTQSGSTYFVTFRLADSIAKSRINEYKELRDKWKAHHLPPYTESEQAQFDELFSERVNSWLDEGAGACILGKPEISQIVADTLTHFEDERYELDEWVVMPNHVHVLVTPRPGFELASILHSWKSYSAQQINQRLKKSEPVWKHESYDHIVRDQEELIRIRKYIRDNPAKAGIHVTHSGSGQGRLEAGDTSSVPPASSRPCPDSVPPASSLPKVIHAQPADLKQIALPYDEYTDEDIAHRRIYVETSRGCPFKCEYCLSSLEADVRFFPPDRIFPAFEKLIGRGVRIFKFLDRSFNINTAHAAAVLRFFLENRRDGMMLHLEWEPERLPPALEKLMTEAPAGFLQLEVGVQTFNPEVAARIDRRLDAEKVEAHIRTLAALPSVHLHADLIAGLPGETLASIAAGFDRLHACGPDEIQLGILKKLRGAPIAKHDVEWQMVYNTSPPYDVLQTATLSFVELQQIRRFARFWDITVNNGRFPHAAPLIWQNQPSVFASFMEWSEWIYQQTHATFGFTPTRLAQCMEEFLTEQRGLSAKTVRHAIEADLARQSAGAKGMERQTRKK
ncbi:MAG TPA: DUF4080 domain-containing protein [Pontiellaceae bacterium]|nr:DUF4080 domain-containing protein [Pontiellaceae bacterium]